MALLFISGPVALKADTEQALREALNKQLLKDGRYQAAESFTVKAAGCTFKGTAAVIGANGSCQVTLLSATDAQGKPLTHTGATPAPRATERRRAELAKRSAPATAPAKKAAKKAEKKAAKKK